MHRRFDSSAAPALELANAIRRQLQREALQEPSEQCEPGTEPVAAIGEGPDPQVAVALETVEGFLANLTALCLERLAPAAEFSLPFDRATLTALQGPAPRAISTSCSLHRPGCPPLPPARAHG